MGCKSCKAVETRGDPHMDARRFRAVPLPPRSADPGAPGDGAVDFRARYHEIHGAQASPGSPGHFRRGPTSLPQQQATHADGEEEVVEYARPASASHTALKRTSRTTTPRSIASSSHRSVAPPNNNGSFAGSVHTSDDELVLVCADCGAEVVDDQCVPVCPVSGKRHL